MSTEPPFDSEDSLPYGFHITGSEGDPIPTPSDRIGPPFDSLSESHPRAPSSGGCDARPLVATEPPFISDEADQ